METYDLVIRQARLNGNIVDIAVYGNRIVKIDKAIHERGIEEINANGGLVLPPFFNMHFHLDSALTLGDPRFNESGTLWEGIEIWAEKKRRLSIDEILKRAETVIKWMVAHGTLWLRTHADVTDKSLTTLKGELAAKEAFRNLINIQVTAFPQDGILTDPENKEFLEKALEMGADNVGLIPHNEWTREDGVKSIQIAFDLAQKYNRDIDGHVDETDDPLSRYLEVLAAETIRRHWENRVSAGHVTASHSWDLAYKYRITPLIRRAGITIIANPLINIHLQGRFDQGPKRRGMAPIKFFMNNGVNVALGHDCVMDPWYPLGVGNMLHVLFMAIHVDHEFLGKDLEKSISLITYNAAKAWRVLDNYGIEPNKPANLLIFRQKTVFDVIRLMERPNYVIKDGRIVAKNLYESEVFFNGKFESITFELENK
jgi:cytosine deaminase